MAQAEGKPRRTAAKRGGRGGVRCKKVDSSSGRSLAAREPLNSRLRLIFTFIGRYPTMLYSRYPLAERGRATARNLRANL